MKHITLFILLIFFGFSSTAQKIKPWFLEVGLRSGGDEEVPIKTPTFSLGVGTKLEKHLSVCAAYTFYSFKLLGPLKVQMQTHTVDLTANIHFYNVTKYSKGLYLGLGFAAQFRNGRIDNLSSYYPTLISNAGYSFPVMIKGRQRSISVDIKILGPFNYSNSFFYDEETLAQFFFGVRLRY